MSNNLDPSSNPLNIETIKKIDHLDLPMMQKHHIRILAHCLQIFKNIAEGDSHEFCDENLLREWCDTQSKKFEDRNFSDLFYKQIDSTAKKLNTFSKKIGKNITDFEIEDLVLLVKEG